MSTDVTDWEELSWKTKEKCANVTLNHNTTYYANVIAYNRGLNPKRINASSDGGKYLYTYYVILI